MNEKLYQKIVVERVNRAWRFTVPDMAQEFHALGLTPAQRVCLRFERLCQYEKPAFLEDEKICFMRCVKKLPEIFTPEEWQEIRAKHHIHELGYSSNLPATYGKLRQKGLLALLPG